MRKNHAISKKDLHTFVETSVFRSTAIVCSCAETSSMVFGRLHVMRRLTEQNEHTDYFSTHG